MTNENYCVLVGVGRHPVRAENLEGAAEPLDAKRYADLAGLLGERAGASPREKLYSALGGNTPQWLVNEAAKQIAAGRDGVALLAGREDGCRFIANIESDPAILRSMTDERSWAPGSRPPRRGVGEERLLVLSGTELLR